MLEAYAQQMQGLYDQVQLSVSAQMATDTIMSVAALPEPDEDISARPELHLLQQQIAATEQQAKMARAGYLPTVALTLGYSYYDNIRLKGTMQASDGNYHPFKDTFNGSSPMALLSVSVPLFHWGTDLKKSQEGTHRGRMTLAELSSFTGLDTLALTKALDCLRMENELAEYTEYSRDYLELRLGYQL